MKRWLPIIAILAAGIMGAIWLSRSNAPGSRAGGRVLSSNELARARVSGGGHHALAIAPDGSLWSWGDVQHGAALGLGCFKRRNVCLGLTRFLSRSSGFRAPRMMNAVGKLATCWIISASSPIPAICVISLTVNSVPALYEDFSHCSNSKCVHSAF